MRRLASILAATILRDEIDVMHDIRLAIGLIAFLSIGFFLLTLRLLRGRPIWLHDVVAVATVALIAVYVKTVWGQLWIVQWIPLPSVLVLSNWFPPLLAILAAATWLRLDPLHLGHESRSHDEDGDEEWIFGVDRRGFLRRVPVMAALVLAAIYSVLHFIPRSPPQCGNEWDPPFPPMTLPVCIQTTDYTCSAAAAATLLNALGYEASEQEMATLCLTKSGTTWLGLYHGLSVKLFRTGYEVKFFEGGLPDLPGLFTGRPVLLCCQLDSESAEDAPEYVHQGGWIPGTAHTVVYLGQFRDRHLIGDPSTGYEVWRDEDLNVLWTGQGLRIEGEPYDEN